MIIGLLANLLWITQASITTIGSMKSQTIQRQRRSILRMHSMIQPNLSGRSINPRILSQTYVWRNIMVRYSSPFFSSDVHTWAGNMAIHHVGQLYIYIR